MPNMVHWTQPAGVVPHLGREEAEARHQDYVGPEHLLVGLLQQDEFLREADSPGPGDDPAAELLQAHGLDLATVRAGSLSPGELRLRSMVGLPNSGPGPVKLLVENEGLTLEGLQAAVRAELDRDR